MFALEIHLHTFMESDVTRYVLASRNKQALEHLGKQCEKIEHELSYSVFKLQDAAQLTCGSESYSDWNFTNHEEYGLGEPLKSIELQQRCREKENPESNHCDRIVPVQNSITHEMRYSLLSEFHSDPKRFLEGLRRKERAMKTGKYYHSPEKYDWYQGVYIKSMANS